ncbi:MAG: DUF2017 domain-containing protein [Nakamurella sp.]
MRLFTGRNGRYSASFEPAEASLLSDLVGQVRTLLAQRRESAPVDPLAELTGLTVGPSTAPEDPAVARLLPDFHRDDPDLSAGMRMLREPEVLAAKDDAAAVLISTLPLSGGPVHLDEATARSWLVAINDVRLVFSVRLAITGDDDPLDAATADRNGPEYAMHLTYRWLSTVLESLTDALLEAHDDDR